MVITMFIRVSHSAYKAFPLLVYKKMHIETPVRTESNFLQTVIEAWIILLLLYEYDLTYYAAEVDTMSLNRICK